MILGDLNFYLEQEAYNNLLMMQGLLNNFLSFQVSGEGTIRPS